MNLTRNQAQLVVDACYAYADIIEDTALQLREVAATDRIGGRLTQQARLLREAATAVAEQIGEA